MHPLKVRRHVFPGRRNNPFSNLHNNRFQESVEMDIRSRKPFTAQESFALKFIIKAIEALINEDLLIGSGFGSWKSVTFEKVDSGRIISEPCEQGLCHK